MNAVVTRPCCVPVRRASDLIAVTGRLGGTQSGKHLLFEPRLAEGEWLARKKFATAMMDLSDGLGADLPRLAPGLGRKFTSWSRKKFHAMAA